MRPPKSLMMMRMITSIMKMTRTIIEKMMKKPTRMTMKGEQKKMTKK